MSSTGGAAIPAAASAADATFPSTSAGETATSSGAAATPPGTAETSSDAAATSTGSSLGTGLAETPTATQRQTRGRLAVLEDTLRSEQQARLEMLEREKYQKDYEHDLSVRFLQCELKRSQQQRRHDMRRHKVELRMLLANEKVKVLELARLEREAASKVLIIK